MNLRKQFVGGIFVGSYLLGFSPASVSMAQSTDARGKEAMTLDFRGTDFVHRWLKDGQNEFTPRSDPDLSTWRDMITVNVHESVANGDQLAELANRILSNYQRRGKILRTDSKPRIADRPAEHLIVAALGDPNFLEAAFARCVLVNGVGFVTAYSHRVYGQAAGPAMSEWLKTNGGPVERALMEWGKLPSPASLKRLPKTSNRRHRITNPARRHEATHCTTFSQHM